MGKFLFKRHDISKWTHAWDSIPPLIAYWITNTSHFYRLRTDMSTNMKRKRSGTITSSTGPCSSWTENITTQLPNQVKPWLLKEKLNYWQSTAAAFAMPLEVNAHKSAQFSNSTVSPTWACQILPPCPMMCQPLLLLLSSILAQHSPSLHISSSYLPAPFFSSPEEKSSNSGCK